jgi:hypothetical protein
MNRVFQTSFPKIDVTSRMLPNLSIAGAVFVARSHMGKIRIDHEEQSGA